MKKVFIASVLALVVAGIGEKLIARQPPSSKTELLPKASQSVPEVKIPNYVAELSKLAVNVISERLRIPAERLKVLYIAFQTALPDVSAFKLIDEVNALGFKYGVFGGYSYTSFGFGFLPEGLSANGNGGYFGLEGGVFMPGEFICLGIEIAPQYVISHVKIEDESDNIHNFVVGN